MQHKLMQQHRRRRQSSCSPFLSSCAVSC
jgi:hypothetical protein